MNDLGEALTVNPDMLFMGGGNPARIPEMETIFKDRLLQVMSKQDELHKMFGIYQAPQGDGEFLQYIGYTDASLVEDFFIAAKPSIAFLDEHILTIMSTLINYTLARRCHFPLAMV